VFVVRILTSVLSFSTPFRPNLSVEDEIVNSVVSLEILIDFLTVDTVLRVMGQIYRKSRVVVRVRILSEMSSGRE
jgi:hypothetical protein